MNILFLRGFNNYHKRTIIKYSTLEDYRSNSNSYLDYSGINFNNNDGITSELIVGSTSQLENNKPLEFDVLGSPDYCVVYETTTENDVVTTTIKSRWFILESVKMRKGQYRLALKRDSIADHMEWLLNADCFIEKGIIQDESSPFIFNKENMTVNQIKKREIPLYDTTRCPWIVGYIAKSYDGNSGANVPVTGKITDVFKEALPMEDTPWGNISQSQIDNGFDFSTVDSANFFPSIEVARSTDIFHSWKIIKGRYQINFDNNNYTTQEYKQYGFWQTFRGNKEFYGGTLGYGISEDWSRNYCPPCIGVSEIQPSIDPKPHITSVQDVITRWVSKSVGGSSFVHRVANILLNNGSYTYYGDRIRQYDGRLVEDKNHVQYTVRVVDRGTLFSTNVISQLNSILYALKHTLLDACNEQSVAEGTQGNFFISDNELILLLNVHTYNITFTKQDPTITVETTLPSKINRFECTDQLFDIFCLPYGNITITNKDTNSVETVIKVDKNASLAAARAMATELGTGNLYDLQILPYCPIKRIREAYEYEVSTEGTDESGNIITVSPYIKYTTNYVVDRTDGKYNGMQFDVKLSTNPFSIVSYVFWASSSHDTINTPVLCSDIRYYQYSEAANNNIIKKKLSNETELFRLCSPNYSGLFEYSPSKNNDIVELDSDDLPIIKYFNVDYNYKPFNPYIHVNPVFNGEDNGAIYGKDWNDVRGLICGGSFSLGYNINAFREYEIQNVNFQNIFNRDIDHMDTMNNLTRDQLQFSNAIGSISGVGVGAIGGAITGAKAGPYGALAGAAVGGTAGGIAGIAGAALNSQWLERQLSENRSYAIDMYNYNLGNIKARPDSISRTDILTENTRDVPFLELYECTEKEIENMMNVFKYNGMTIMTINKLKNFIGYNDDSNYMLSLNVKNNYCYYIKGQLIMNTEEELNDDFHLIDDIYSELNKGIYLQGK